MEKDYYRLPISGIIVPADLIRESWQKKIRDSISFQKMIPHWIATEVDFVWTSREIEILPKRIRNQAKQAIKYRKQNFKRMCQDELAKHE